jgi:hypothetical protein
MDDPITWGNAQITWDADRGYELRLPLWADARALSLRHDRLSKAIRSALPGRQRIVETVYPMVRREDETGASAEAGEIIIQTDSMLTENEARVLREEVSAAMQGAVAEGEEAVAADNEAAGKVLAVLKLDP